MELLPVDFEEGFTGEETANVRVEESVMSLSQFYLCRAVLSGTENRSGNYRTSEPSFVNRKMKCLVIDLTVVLDFLLRVSVLSQSRDTSVPSSLQIRFKKCPSPMSR